MTKPAAKKSARKTVIKAAKIETPEVELDIFGDPVKPVVVHGNDDELLTTKTGLFDLINDVSERKLGLFHAAPDGESVYSPFMVMDMLSRHPDCIFAVNILNQRANGEMSKKWHHDYLFHTIRSRKRYGGKIEKADPAERVDLIIQTFGYSRRVAETVIGFFTDGDFDAMRARQFKGGEQGKAKVKTLPKKAK